MDAIPIPGFGPDSQFHGAHIVIREHGSNNPTVIAIVAEPEDRNGRWNWDEEREYSWLDAVERAARDYHDELDDYAEVWLIFDPGRDNVFEVDLNAVVQEA